MEQIKIQYGKIEARPEEVGYDSSRIDVLNRHFQAMIDDGRLIGASYCIARKGKVVAQNGLGGFSYHTEDNRPMLPDTIFSLASITKMFTATAVWTLVEDGFILLDEPISKYLQEMDTPELKGITIAHMLTHTSGIHPGGGCFPMEKADSFGEIAKLKPGDEDWIRAGLKVGLRRPVGTEWQYNSFGYVLLGALIERVSGVKAESYITKRIIEPLGLKDTTFFLNEEQAKRHFLADKETEQDMNAIISKQEGDPGIWRKVPMTAGGIHSTPFDLVRFGNALCFHGRFDGVRILGKMAVEKMTASYLKDIPDHCWGANTASRQYALGPDKRSGVAITVSDSFFFHEGWGYCCLAVDPREELVTAWYVPYCDQSKWYRESLINVKNIIWSGII